ncbi:hypothetical protein ACWDKQ_06805 [Saccharopolyspora sp. NPDC000995]
MAHTTLTATSMALNREINSSLVVDLIWVMAGTEYGLEYLHAVTQPGRIDIIAFCLVTDTRAAHRAGRRMCQDAITASPQLRGWRISPGA